MSYESEFWGDCLNTFDEEAKHFVYARYMGLQQSHYSFLVNGARILDIGGGPVSMLLKCSDRGKSAVLDPLLGSFPKWVRERYKKAGIAMLAMRGEDQSLSDFDEAWVYNVLQHVDDPELVIANARKAAKLVRLFEWIDIPAYDGHPHELKAADLSRWLSEGDSRTLSLAEGGCHGSAFSGVFA